MIEIEYKKVKNLHPYEHNARTHSDEQILQIAESIKNFGFTNPILIKEDNTIIAGHGRLEGAKLLLWEEVPTITLKDLTEEQIRAYIIMDNKLALEAGWDKEILAFELQELYDLGFNLDLTGFNVDEILDLGIGLGSLHEGANSDDADEVPELPTVPIIKEGDLIEMDKHRLLCGSATDRTAIEKLMGEVKADHFLTDPPYNVAYEGKTAEKMTIENDEMEDTEFRQFLVDAFRNADFALKEGGVFQIAHADSEGYNFRGACNDVGWKVRQCLIWMKNSMVIGRQDYHWKHEPILVGWKEGAGHTWNNDRKQTTILEFNKPTVNDIHPTMKPVDLWEYLLTNNTKVGQIVLDLFMGSGTTIIACENTQRIGYGTELDPKYAQAIVQRWTDYTSVDTIKINGVEVSWEDYKTSKEAENELADAK